MSENSHNSTTAKELNPGKKPDSKLVKRGRSKRGFKWVLYLLFLLIVFEIATRSFFSIAIDIPFFKQDRIFLKYYPELRPYLDQTILAKEGQKNVLILGGSVVNVNFCNFQDLLNNGAKASATGVVYGVDTLAKYAQNSLDSWYKYDLLRHRKYDNVLFYHGINDTRTNNCPSDVFDLDYRQVEFYNELFVLFRHPEINLTILPYLTDFLIQKLLSSTGIKPTIPKEYNIMEFYFDKKITNTDWWEYANEIKSKNSFRRNLDRIASLSVEKKEKLIVISYAWFQPDDYTFEGFIAKKLGYTDHAWPTEIYGPPAYVPLGIQAHNEIGREITRKYPNLKHLEFADSLPKEGPYFLDICHLTPLGCQRLGEAVFGMIK